MQPSLKLCMTSHRHGMTLLVLRSTSHSPLVSFIGAATYCSRRISGGLNSKEEIKYLRGITPRTASLVAEDNSYSMHQVAYPTTSLSCRQVSLLARLSGKCVRGWVDEAACMARRHRPVRLITVRLCKSFFPLPCHPRGGYGLTYKFLHAILYSRRCIKVQERSREPCRNGLPYYGAPMSEAPHLRAEGMLPSHIAVARHFDSCRLGFSCRDSRGARGGSRETYEKPHTCQLITSACST